ncbi:hypothetical protein [Pararhodobacter zhoushanensis]|uniref:hypothetical protein n=1 Tax=Pararhodobacter zhoushanensis TaxID=2479545 RepID=UPI000F8C3730|nr:hypothetical protein [Pararhodobacter zhoushanensis]
MPKSVERLTSVTGSEKVISHINSLFASTRSSKGSYRVIDTTRGRLVSWAWAFWIKALVQHSTTKAIAMCLRKLRPFIFFPLSLGHEEQATYPMGDTVLRLRCIHLASCLRRKDANTRLRIFPKADILPVRLFTPGVLKQRQFPQLKEKGKEPAGLS